MKRRNFVNYFLGGSLLATVAAFLRTLTGRQPRVENPILPPSSDATPRPELRLGPGG